MKINAILQRKETEIEASPCEVDRIIELSGSEFASFWQDLLKERPFIAENARYMGVNNGGVYHCLLVLGKGCDDGILVHSSGAGYARYSSLIPNARQIVEAGRRSECIKTLEKRLSDACDEVISCTPAYDAAEPYRAMLRDLAQEHGFDEAYIPLFLEMLAERPGGFTFETDKDELIIRLNERNFSETSDEPGEEEVPVMNM